MFNTREEYLIAASTHILNDILMPIVEEWNEKDKGALDDPKFRVSCGWAKHSSSKAVGSCFVKAVSSDDTSEIFISPEMDEPVLVLATLVHELIHAIDNAESGHKGWFAFAARKVGLEGKLTATVAGDVLAEELRVYSELLGKYPHAAMSPNPNRKKQTTRMLKVECSDCGFVFRTSAKWADGIHDMSPCPVCEEVGTLEKS
jgi:predicted Zn-ribbon and HTH transcriptional regulator